MYRCSMCKQLKPAEEYHKNSGKKSGLKDYCKTCCAVRKHKTVKAANGLATDSAAQSLSSPAPRESEQGDSQILQIGSQQLQEDGVRMQNSGTEYQGGEQRSHNIGQGGSHGFQSSQMGLQGGRQGSQGGRKQARKAIKRSQAGSQAGQQGWPKVQKRSQNDDQALQGDRMRFQKDDRDLEGYFLKRFQKDDQGSHGVCKGSQNNDRASQGDWTRFKQDNQAPQGGWERFQVLKDDQGAQGPRQGISEQLLAVASQPVTWASPLAEPPAGMFPVDGRTYFSGFRKNNQQIQLHDSVELLPPLGESEIRVAMLEALWSDQHNPNLKLAKCKMYISPKATAFNLLVGDPQVLFLTTDEVNERLNLAQVLSRCSVQARGAKASLNTGPAATQGSKTYYCEYVYDSRRATLSALKI